MELTVAGLVVLLVLFFAYRTRRQLAASEARYRGLFERAADGIAILDDDGIVREANPRLAELLGLPQDQLVGRRLRDFYAATQASSSSGGGGADAGVMNDHLAALAGTLRMATRTLMRGDGRQVDAEIAFARADGPEGGPILQAMVRDVTQRRVRERHRLEEGRLDAIARFAGGIAHQFNNLLGGILTHVSILRQDATQAPAAAELDEVAAAARRGRDLTEELLRFTRSDPLQLRPTDPAQALESVSRLAHRLLAEGGAGGADVEVHLAPGLPPIAADIDQLVHACTQVVLNARDAMRGRPNPKVTLAAAEEGGGSRVRITITDNGRGMDAATVDRAFEPFFTTKPMHQAKGLGLATVQRVMRDHHGSVRIESEIGHGTSVHLLFLVSREPLPAVPPAPPPPPPPAREAKAAGATILIVDDEPIVRSSLKRALGRFGYRVLEAGDGGAAVAALKAAHPPVDLVILDLVLPGGGAGIFELLKAVRPDVKVLISSGYSPDTDAARGLAARVEGFLPKPYELTQLRDAVTQALSGRAA